ncbi:MAG: efflux RND transporter periplasmic adaptor subunit [Pseudomonadales bacterium]|nr:efflux RND transporter periplasmic adaptor subunit [Pseudomonadales bacterium]
MRYVFTLLLLFALTAVNAEPQPVRVVAVTTDSITYSVRTFGRLSPQIEDLSFQIPGRISRFHIVEGDRVSRGQLLAELDTKDATDNLRRAESELASAQRLLDRMQTLFEARSVQKSQLEDTRATFEQARIAHEQAALNVARCKLAAPANGIVLKQVIESRTTISPGLPVFVFQADDEQWITKVELTDRNALLMEAGAEAEVLFAPYPDHVFSGQVTSIAQVANESDGLFTAEIAISTQNIPLRPGMIAEVNLSRVSNRSFSIVPFDALLSLRRNKGVIFTLNPADSTVTEVPVTIHQINEGQVALEEALPPATQIVVSGQHALQDGASVIVAD